MRSPYGVVSEWGIFSRNGTPVLMADSVEGVEYQSDFRISDAPQEQGAFMSYNKVKVPWQAKIRFLVGGSIQNKNQFLQQAEALCRSLDLFTVATPEVSYPSANLTNLGYDRSARQGAQLMRVEVWCEEVRIISAAALSNTKSTNAATPENSGTVQPQQGTTTPGSSPGIGLTGGTGGNGTGPGNTPGGLPASVTDATSTRVTSITSTNGLNSTLVTRVPPVSTDLRLSEEFQTPVTLNPADAPVRTVGSQAEAYQVILNSPINTTVGFMDGPTRYELSAIPTPGLYYDGPPPI